MDDIHRRFCCIKILMFLAKLYSVHLKLFVLGTEKNEIFSHVEYLVLVGVAELLLADTQLYSGSLVCQDVRFCFSFFVS